MNYLIAESLSSPILKHRSINAEALGRPISSLALSGWVNTDESEASRSRYLVRYFTSARSSYSSLRAFIVSVSSPS